MKLEEEPQELEQIQFMFPAQHSHPLPRRYCVLSGVALLKSFPEWLEKLGKTFGGFLTSMH